MIALLQFIDPAITKQLDIKEPIPVIVKAHLQQNLSFVMHQLQNLHVAILVLCFIHKS